MQQNAQHRELLSQQEELQRQQQEVAEERRQNEILQEQLQQEKDRIATARKQFELQKQRQKEYSVNDSVRAMLGSFRNDFEFDIPKSAGSHEIRARTFYPKHKPMYLGGK